MQPRFRRNEQSRRRSRAPDAGERAGRRRDDGSACDADGEQHNGNHGHDRDFVYNRDDDAAMKRLITAVALSLVACQQETAQQSQATPPQQEAPRQQAAGSATRIDPTLPQQQHAGGVTGVASPDQPVQLIEYAVRMPQTLKAGKQSFYVENAGKESHSLEIEGGGVETGLTTVLSRGSRGQMEVDLKPGTYTFYCPIEGHREKGMALKVTVE